MTLRTPPRLATWLLEHLGPRYQRESLAGDLFEEFQQQRSPAWYWRQVLIALVMERAVHTAALLARLGASRILRRCIEAIVVATLSAGALTWAASSTHTPHQSARASALQIE